MVRAYVTRELGDEVKGGHEHHVEQECGRPLMPLRPILFGKRARSSGSIGGNPISSQHTLIHGAADTPPLRSADPYGL